MYLHMKHMVLFLRKLFIYFLLIFLSGCNSCPDAFEPIGTESSSNLDLPNDTLRVYCSEDQFNLTWQLTKEFQKCHTGILTEISIYKRRTPIEILTLGRNDLLLVSDAHSPIIPEKCWSIKYARDGVVGIINKSNPFYKEILEFGLGKQQLTYILTEVKSDSWSQGLGYEKCKPIKVFISSGDFLPGKLLADFLGITSNDFLVVRTANVQDMIDSIRMKPLSMGFCCQRYAYDPLTRKEIEEIKVIPIDCNSNGILEDKEKFYESLDLLQRAMWLGKYPCHSFLNYYIVTTEKPENKLHIEFMKWVLTEGQKELHTEGYIMLRTRIINTEIKELNEFLAST